MLRTLWRLSRGSRLRPWRSPYLRWRIETFSGLHADQITFRDFWVFVWRRRRDLARYLKWASTEGRPAEGRNPYRFPSDPHP
ncbi:MAG: hypothetical protein C5B51_25725 [Terriglobia bacterium]|nr:MAG: hypothetical protein C5B51_25725 [Terriglobia bacterium]